MLAGIEKHVYKKFEKNASIQLKTICFRSVVNRHHDTQENYGRDSLYQ